MVILNIKINGFGDIISKEYALSEGISNIHCSSYSEALTIRDFIVSVLYGFGGRTSGGDRKKYFPGTMLKFGGELLIEYSGRKFLITRQWGLTCSDDTLRVFEEPGTRQLRIQNNRTIGEQLFNISKEAFLSSFMLDLNNSCSFAGYVTAEMSLSEDKAQSFAAADKAFNDKLLSIKSVEDKSGELDRTVIRKMSMNNELTRLSETDQKITAKSTQLESLKAEKAKIKQNAKGIMKKIMLARSCETLIVKDKATNILGGIETDTEDLDQLREIAAYNYGRSFFRESMALIVLLALGAALVVMGITISSILIYIGAGLFALGVVLLILKSVKFSKRFNIMRKGSVVNVYDEIDNAERKIGDETAQLTQLLEGRTYNEALEGWHEAEEILKNATEEERHDAVLTYTEDDDRLYEETLGAIKPIDEKIESIEKEIDALTQTLTKSYSEATGVLTGIDEKIKSLSEEYRITEIAYGVYKDTVAEIRDSKLPAVFELAVKIFTENYGTANVSYSCDDLLGINIACSEEDIYKAKLSLKLAIAKTVYTGEFGMAFASFTNIPDEIKNKMPAEIKQVICFAD